MAILVLSGKTFCMINELREFCFVGVKFPKELLVLLDRAVHADISGKNRSDYIRAAVIAQLQADGLFGDIFTDLTNPRGSAEAGILNPASSQHGADRSTALPHSASVLPAADPPLLSTARRRRVPLS